MLMKTLINSGYILLFYLLIIQEVSGQNVTGVEQLPFNIVAAVNDTNKPMIVYITGDGGWNSFSKKLCGFLALKGYPVVALNARSYFWQKKTIAQTTLDIARLTRVYEKTWNRKKIVLMGYSFGAEIIPFVFNTLPAAISSQVLNLCLVSPTPFTDFEIHISALLGFGVSKGDNVVSEINKISTKPVTLIFGNDENDFSVSRLKIKNYTNTRLKGGHHYEGDEATLSNTIVQHIPN